VSVAQDLYGILGVPPDATQDDIKRAYRKLARAHHPDVNADPEAERRFKEIAGAYEILSDPERRRRYDAFGEQGGPGGSPFADVQDIFDLFFGAGGFGGMGSRRAPRPTRTARGEDLRLGLRLSFEEAAFGMGREVEIERLRVCERCLGAGAEPGTAPVSCSACGGTGQLQEVRRSIFGQLVTAAPCLRCEATGLEISDPCTECSGAGRTTETASVSIDVPAGVADGIEMRVPGQGNAGRAGGPSGDLYVPLHVEPSPVFERVGQDLHADLQVSMTQAALGAELEIQTLDGTEVVRVRPGAQSGEVVSLKGKGIPNLQRRGRGDLHLALRVATPTDLARSERKLLEELAQARDEAAGKGARSAGSLRRPDHR
jgi:molecular chaperone DnaJ